MSHRNTLNNRQISQDGQRSDSQSPDILQQLLNNSEWQPVPEIVYLSFKAIKQILANYSQKFSQQRFLLNQLSIKTNQIDVNLMNKINRKDFSRQAENIIRSLLHEKTLMEINDSQEELQQQQGLDRIMIEEVKTIANTIIQQKIKTYNNLSQDIIILQQKNISLHKQLSKQNQFIENLQFKIKNQMFNFQQLTTKHHHQMIQYLRKTNIQKMYKSNSFQIDTKKSNNQTIQIKNIIQKIKIQFNQQITLIKQKLQKKKKIEQNKQFNQFKHKIQKQLFGTVKLEEIQNIITSVKKQTLDKYTILQKEINGINSKLNKLNKKQVSPSKEQRDKEQNQTRIKQKQKKNTSISQSPAHHQSVKQIKMTLARVEKALSFNEGSITTRVAQNLIEKAIENQNKFFQEQMTKRQKKICQFMESHCLNLSQKDNRQNKSQIKKALLAISQQLVQCRYLYYGQKQSKGLIIWQKQGLNTMPENYTWIKGDSTIIVHAGGLYKVQGGLYGEKSVQCHLLLNNESIGVFKLNQSVNTFNKKARGYVFSQTILLPSKIRVSMRVQKTFYGQAFIQIHKL